MGTAPLERAVASIAFPVVGDDAPTDWSTGPLPLKMPDGRPAEASVRATYFQPLAASVLYGSTDRPSRWHRLVADGSGRSLPVPVRVVGMELMKVPQWRPVDGGISFLAVLHVELPIDNPVEALSAVVRLDRGARGVAGWRTAADRLLGPGLRIDPTWQRAISTCFLRAHGELPALDDAPGEWTRLSSWLWLAASATPFSDFPPDTEDPGLLAGVLYLSRTWRGLALRDGVGFVGVSKTAVDDSFLASAELYTSTIYTDVVLLALLQRIGLDSFAEELSRIGNRFEKSEELRLLVNAVTEYHNVLWWDDVTQHGVANELLRRIHAARRTPELLERVTADLASFQQQVETQASESMFQAQKDDEQRARRFDRFVAVASIAFALPLLVFTCLLLPITGLTAGDREFAWWQVLLIAVIAAAIGASAGHAADAYSHRKDSEGRPARRLPRR
jgi:hypothetical protein